MNDQNVVDSKKAKFSVYRKYIVISIAILFYFLFPLCIAIKQKIGHPDMNETIFTFENSVAFSSFIPCTLVIAIVAGIYIKPIIKKIIAIFCIILIGAFILSNWINVCTNIAEDVFVQYKETTSYAKRREKETKIWLDDKYEFYKIDSQYTLFYEYGNQDDDVYTAIYISNDREYIFTYACEKGFELEKGRTYHGENTSVITRKYNKDEIENAINNGQMTSVTKQVGNNGITDFTVFKYKNIADMDVGIISYGKSVSAKYMKIAFDNGDARWYYCTDFPNALFENGD